jgi:citrate lyase subunit beta/citryl-CoA lyase
MAEGRASRFDPVRLRTLLFIPADDVHKCEQAWTSGADAVIFDLEDAVAPAFKAQARDTLRRVLERRLDGPAVVVRINAPNLADGEADLALLADLVVDAMMVPKAQMRSLQLIPSHAPPVIALVETASGLLHAEEVACAESVCLLMFGPADLTAELGCEPSASGEELLLARSQLVLASAAAGLPAPIDGPSLAIRDNEVLRAEAQRAKRLGFGGKACIHPAQLEEVRRAFTPSETEIDWARRVVDAYHAALAQGAGVASRNGRMIDVPVARRAYRILERSGDKSWPSPSRLLQSSGAADSLKTSTLATCTEVAWDARFPKSTTRGSRP